jgi:hypothetical protein
MVLLDIGLSGNGCGRPRENKNAEQTNQDSYKRSKRQRKRKEAIGVRRESINTWMANEMVIFALVIIKGRALWL